jgi:hypothetical protein
MGQARVAAEAVLLLHVLWCVWVLLGWTVTRGRHVLRMLHITSLAYAIVIELVPWPPCPLTVAEIQLEARAGVQPAHGPKAYRHWASLEKAQAEPKWANIKFPPIDYQSIVYYSAPQNKASLKSLDELDSRFYAPTRSWAFRFYVQRKAGRTQTHPSEQLTREASHRSAMEQGRVQQLVSLQNGGNLQSSANLSIPVAKRKGPFDIAPLQSGGTP